jgi:hypothetical protein
MMMLKALQHFVTMAGYLHVTGRHLHNSMGRVHVTLLSRNDGILGIMCDQTEVL